MDDKSVAKYQFVPSTPVTAWIVLAGLVIVGIALLNLEGRGWVWTCLLYTSPSPRDS